MTTMMLNEARRTAPNRSTYPWRAEPADVLLCAATLGGQVREWSLLAVASLLLGRAVTVVELDGLFAAGFVTRDPGGQLAVAETVASSVKSVVPPTLMTAAHRAWTEVLVDDPLGRARHELLAGTHAGTAAARRCVAVARQLQEAGRHEHAVELFEQAARLSPAPSDQSSYLVQGAATALAAGNSQRGREMSTAARVVDPGGSGATAAAVLAMSYSDTLGVDDPRGDDILESIRLLLEWGQSSAAFVVLAATRRPGTALAELRTSAADFSTLR